MNGTRVDHEIANCRKTTLIHLLRICKRGSLFTIPYTLVPSLKRERKWFWERQKMVVERWQSCSLGSPRVLTARSKGENVLRPRSISSLLIISLSLSLCSISSSFFLTWPPFTLPLRWSLSNLRKDGPNAKYLKRTYHSRQECLESLANVCLKTKIRFQLKIVEINKFLNYF